MRDWLRSSPWGVIALVAAAGLCAFALAVRPGAAYTELLDLSTSPRLAPEEPLTASIAAIPERPAPAPADPSFEVFNDDDAIVEVDAVDGDGVRWFNGRPVRPVRNMLMRTTAYSPDARSCAPFDDGITASGYSVWTNGGKIIAADTRMFKFGSLISVPGYNGGRPTPVLDRGGRIKGSRLDLLYPTHEEAREWGVKWQVVTVWEYADEG
ncbi:MAG: 3D domain-containing protein [Phycisphaerales bacterium]